MRSPGFFEILVFTGVAYVGDRVDFFEVGHDRFGNGEGGDDVVELFLEVLQGVLDPDSDFLQVVGALVEGEGEAFEELVFVEGL